jgi:cell division protein ZapB
MSEKSLKSLERKLDELIELCEALNQENQLLKSEADSWKVEREKLVEKNELAREKVEAMIQRLRALEQQS